MKCSIATCSSSPMFQCICNNERKYFCEPDLTKHIVSNSGANHQTSALDAQIDSRVKPLVVTKLEDLQKKISDSKRQLTADFSRTISAFEDRFRKIISDMDDKSRDLVSFIKILTSSTGQLKDCRIKKVLEMPFDKAKQEISSWDSLYNFSLNSYEMSESIKKYGSQEDEFEYIFTNKERKQQAKEMVAEPSRTSLHKSGTLKQEDFERLNNPPAQSAPPAQQAPPASSSLNRPERNSISRSQKCNNGHDLKWTITVPFNYYKKCKSFFINCDRCKTMFSASCWNCASCCYDLCEKCGNDVGLVSPKLKCEQNHELFWRPDTCFYYETKGRGHNFKCRICNQIKNEPNWHCRFCDYDVCKNCASTRYNQNPIASSAKCKQGHNLTSKVVAPVNISGMLLTPKCDCCSNNFQGQALICESCNYFICFNCKEFFESPSAGHPIFRCQQTHLLRWVKPETFQCDACYKKLQQEHYKCKECNFDLCFECSDVMLTCIIKNDKKTHGNQSHPLTWVCHPSWAENGATGCNLCGLKYKTGMYCCKTCRNSYCALCYNQPDRPKPQVSQGGMQGGEDLLARLMAMQLLAGMNRNN